MMWVFVFALTSTREHVSEALGAAALGRASTPLGAGSLGSFNVNLEHPGMRRSAASGRAATFGRGRGLRSRGRECVLRYDRMLSARRGVEEHVRVLEAAVTSESSTIRVPPRLKQQSVAKALAVLLRGQAFRGVARDTAFVDPHTLQARSAAQAMCLRSLVQRLIEPYERAGHRVDLFLTVYKHLGGPMRRLLEPLGERVVSVTTVHQRWTPSQLLPLAIAVRAFLAWSAEHSAGYAAVVITRFDLYLKPDMHALLGDATGIDGFRFLFRESGGHWRHHSERDATNRTFAMDSRHSWRRNPRAPDAMLAFPFAYTRCFLGATRNELFPVRNESRPLGFLHNMIPALRMALPEEGTHQPPRLRYVVEGQYDSNPCRATCMLNPIYDLQPRMEWVVASGICQRMEDFAYDPASRSLCCPAPNYCCPNSVSSCNDPGAVRFDVERAGVSPEVIVQHWPLGQSRPFSWELTPRSREIVRDAWLGAAAKARPNSNPSPERLRRAAHEVMTSSTFRRKNE